jgi:hypothetical protein
MRAREVNVLTSTCHISPRMRFHVCKFFNKRGGITPDGLVKLFLEPRKERSRYRALDPTPVDGDDATYLPFVPTAAHPDIHSAYALQPFGGYGSLP